MSTTTVPGTTEIASAVSVVTKSDRVSSWTAMIEFIGFHHGLTEKYATWNDATTTSNIMRSPSSNPRHGLNRPDSSTGGRYSARVTPTARRTPVTTVNTSTWSQSSSHNATS